MDDWKAWIREIAYERIDQIERQLNANPDAFQEFAAAAGKLDAAMEETDAHPDVKLTERDDLWMTYSRSIGAGNVSGGYTGRRARVSCIHYRRTAGDSEA